MEIPFHRVPIAQKIMIDRCQQVSGAHVGLGELMLVGQVGKLQTGSWCGATMGWVLVSRVLCIN